MRLEAGLGTGPSGPDRRSREPIRCLSGHAQEALLVESGDDIAAREPANLPRPDFLVTNRLGFGNVEQEADVVVLMKGLARARRNLVDIQIENLATAPLRKNPEIAQSRFLFRLASCRGQDIDFPVRMATELQPPAELSMIRQQCAAALSGNDPCG